ncbi:unnamed protein product [Blepharisma stoltei]|uniref:FCP1 homology domain-containing protein n=1 Tax=Blepharisma stoltei TaxID=1481888 RepID=A0AAU9JFQ8_9CILI|nr:unnamed protein product [Blepharisma stoltei]
MSSQVNNQGGRQLSRASSGKIVRKLTISTNDEKSSDLESFMNLGKNSPHAINIGKSNVLGSPSSASNSMFSFPNSQTQIDLNSKIKSPTRYVFSTHSHSRIFASGTPKLHSSSKSNLQPRVLTPKSSNSSSLNSSKKEPMQEKSLNSLQAPQKKSNVNDYTVNSVVTRVQPVATKVNDTPYKEHLFQTFQSMKFIKNLRLPTDEELAHKIVNLPRRRGCEYKKTVVFDLDETLVHCVEDANNAHVPISIDFPTGETVIAGINIRPYAKEALMAANKDYEVIVFTASHKCYADRVLDYLDPTGVLIHHRLYRENCLFIDGVYIKDLRILANRQIKDTVIVDNAAYSFAYQLDNGIPIVSWHDDMTDRELYKLIEYLRSLSRLDDIRIANRQTFHLDTFYADYIRDYIRQTDKENMPPTN